MKILIISDDVNKDENYRLAFSPVAERNEIQICRSIIEADAFVSRELILYQRHLDLIITELFASESRSSREFCYDLRNDHQHSFGSYNFKLSSIPIILIHPQRLDKNQYLTFGFDEVISNEDEESFFISILNRSKNIVKKWRNLVYEDLETLKIGKEQNFLKASFKLQQSKAQITRILTETYVRSQNKLNVSWFQRNHRQLESGLDRLAKKINDAEKSVRKEEKNFHRIINSNQELILRGSYIKHFYEKPLPKSEHYRRQIPDYLLQPYYRNDELELMEFKTPNEQFFEKIDFHQTLRKRIFKHIGQVKDYKDYFEDPENEKQLETTFGLKPIKVHYNLVIGRRSDFGSNPSLYAKRARHFNMEDIKIVTFDDFVDYGERYHKELIDLSV